MTHQWIIIYMVYEMDLFALRIRRWGQQHNFQGGFQGNGRETGVPKWFCLLLWACSPTQCTCIHMILSHNTHLSKPPLPPFITLTHLHLIRPPWIIPLPLSKFNALTISIGFPHPPSSSINVAFHIHKLMCSFYLVF